MNEPTCPGCKERDERIKELKADFVAVAPVVRAAMEQVTARDAWTALIDSAASATYYDACETTEGAARALPADVRERLMALSGWGWIMSSTTTITIAWCWMFVVCMTAVLQIIPETTAAVLLLCGILAISLTRQLCDAITGVGRG